MNQKPEQVEAWLNEQYPAIHAEARPENAEIFFRQADFFHGGPCKDSWGEKGISDTG